MQSNKLKIRKWALIILIIITVGLLISLIPEVQKFISAHWRKDKQEFIFRKILLCITLCVILIISLLAVKGKSVKLWVCLLCCLAILLYSGLIIYSEGPYVPDKMNLKLEKLEKFSKEIATDDSVGFFICDSVANPLGLANIVEFETVLPNAFAPRKIITPDTAGVYIVSYEHNINNKEIAGYRVIDSAKIDQTTLFKLYKKQK